MNNLVNKKTEQIKKKRYQQCKIEILQPAENDVLMSSSGRDEEYHDPFWDNYMNKCREEEEYKRKVEEEFEEKRMNGTLTSYDIWKARNQAGVNGIILDHKYYDEEEELKKRENSDD